MQISANVKYHVTQMPFCCISSPLHDLHTNWGRTNWHDNSAAARPGWEQFSHLVSYLTNTRLPISLHAAAGFPGPTMSCHVSCLRRHGCLNLSLSGFTDTAKAAGSGRQSRVAPREQSSDSLWLGRDTLPVQKHAVSISTGLPPCGQPAYRVELEPVLNPVIFQQMFRPR